MVSERMPAVEIVLPEEPAQADAIRCISIMQPWAYLVASGIKDIENREWDTSYRGPLLIHTGKKPDVDYFCDDGSLSPYFERKFGLALAKIMPQRIQDYAYGALIGIADLVNSVTVDTLEVSNDWFRGTYGFVLANARPFVEPIPYKGATSLFNVPRSAIASAVLGEPVTLFPEEPEPVVVPTRTEPVVEMSPRVARTLERCKKLNVSPEELTVRVFRNIRKIEDLSDSEYAEFNTALLRVELMYMQTQKKPKKNKVAK
jgi:hypothetical protein